MLNCLDVHQLCRASQASSSYYHNEGNIHSWNEAAVVPVDCYSALTLQTCCVSLSADDRFGHIRFGRILPTCVSSMIYGACECFLPLYPKNTGSRDVCGEIRNIFYRTSLD